MVAFDLATDDSAKRLERGAYAFILYILNFAIPVTAVYGPGQNWYLAVVFYTFSP